MADPKKEPIDDIEAAIEEIMGDQGQGDSDEKLQSLDEMAEEEVDHDAADAEEIAALRTERDELRDKFMRALADAENVRKRADRDRREAENYGGSKLARDMLPVYDNMKRALDAIDDELREKATGLTEGIELTMRSLLDIFSKHGITILTPEVGDKFDPEHHEAMFEAPVPNTTKGHIIQVMAEGFLLHDRLLRPAQVGVSSNPG
ncbi:nucleotide exchange factor GrpE [Maritimibacter dapengensis]|uniref:Protein GrpE n=1 Tax=Maritimibacter dapengensis TaxID=2836868 RepID=A0ABS6T4J4_9RHOB|nr:nucleotide exchange factor GrpE [Maritimibacter dapengensis]MBV7380069.1 nucleotide exchange factor GrpE [Maritimibacter dapengensis]